MQTVNDLFERISVAQLGQKVLEVIRKERPNTSRNTIWLALKARKATTPLRCRICEVAESLLEEHEAKKDEPAEAVAA